MFSGTRRSAYTALPPGNIAHSSPGGAASRTDSGSGVRYLSE